MGFLSAEENAVLVLRIRGWDADAAAERAASALTRASLADRVGSASTGSRPGKPSAWRWPGRSRVRGAADRGRADLTAGRRNARAVAALLAAAAHEEGQTVICATHDSIVISQADHVVVWPDS